MHRVRMWLRALVARRSVERDLERELQFHIERETQENLRRGLAPAEARRQALLAFGGVERHRESVRDQRGTRWLEDLVADMRLAVRSLRRRPGFALLAAITLAIGMGATVAVYSVANWILLRPVPGVRDPDRAVGIQFVQIKAHSMGMAGVSAPDLADLARGTPALTALGGAGFVSLQLGRSDMAARSVEGVYIAGDYFGALGLRPEVGRFFLPDELDRPGATPGMVISDALWRTAFGADSAVLGRHVWVNAVDFTIIGVAPPRFRGTHRTLTVDTWIPLAAEGAVQHFRAFDPRDRSMSSLAYLVGRLRPGATREQAQEQLDAAAATLAEAYPEASGHLRTNPPTVYPLGGQPNPAWHHRLVTTVRLLFAIALLVLIVASANTANLLLLRGVHRRGEFAVRRALGGSVGRLLRQHVAEGIVLALLGGVLATGLAFALARLSNGSTLVTRWSPGAVAVDGHVVRFAVLLCIGTGVVFGLVPGAFAVRGGYLAHLGDAGRAESHSQSRLRSALAALQIAVAVGLVADALLLTRTLLSVQQLPLGFDAHQVLTAMVDPSPQGYTPERVAALRQNVWSQLSRARAVQSASLATPIPFLGSTVGGAYRRPSDAPDHWLLFANTFFVSPGYFATLRLPIAAGRPFSEAEFARGARNVVVVNRAAARALFGRDNVLGQQLAGSEEAFLLIRSPLSTNDVQALARAAVDAFDPSLPLERVQPLQDDVDAATSDERLFARLVGILAALAAALAAVGLYSLVAYTVAERTREIGLRMALGAQSRAIVGSVVRRAVGLVVAGLALGTGVALVLSRLLQSHLYGVQAWDVPTHVAAVVIALALTVLASAIPARAATRVDPVDALRHE